MRNLGQPPPDAPPGPPGDDEADESLAGAIGSEGAGSSGGASLTDEKWPEVLIIPRQTKIDQRQTRYTRISMDSTYVHYGCDCGGTVKFNRGGDKTGLAQKRNEHERNKKQHKDWLANGGTTTAAAPAPAGPSSQGGALVSHQVSSNPFARMMDKSIAKVQPQPISLLQDLPAVLLATIAEVHDYYNDFYCRDQEEFYKRELGEGEFDHIPRIFVLGCVSRTVRAMLQHVRPVVTAEVWTQAARIEQSDMWHVGELHLNDELPPVQPFSKLHTIKASLGDTATAKQQRKHLSRIASWVAQTGAPLRKLGFYTLCRDLPPVEHLTDLSSFTIDGEKLRDISVVGSFPNLHSLQIGQCCKRMIDISAVALCPALQSIELMCLRKLTDISPISKCHELRKLQVHGLPRLTDISAVASLAQLQYAKLSSCEKLADISPIAYCTELQTLELHGLKLLTDASAFASLAQLRHIVLSDCWRLEDISLIASCAELRTCKIEECPCDTDIFSHDPCLRTVRLTVCRPSDVLKAFVTEDERFEFGVSLRYPMNDFFRLYDEFRQANGHDKIEPYTMLGQCAAIFPALGCSLDCGEHVLVGVAPKAHIALPSNSTTLVLPPSDPQPPSPPTSPPGSGSVDGDVNPPLLTLDQPTQPMVEDKLQQALDWCQSGDVEESGAIHDLWVAGVRQAVESCKYEALVQLLELIPQPDESWEPGATWDSSQFAGHAGEMCRILTLAIHYGAPSSIVDDIRRTMNEILGCWECRLFGLIEEVYIPCAQRVGTAHVGEELAMIMLMLCATEQSETALGDFMMCSRPSGRAFVHPFEFVRVNQGRYPHIRQAIESAVEKAYGFMEEYNETNDEDEDDYSILTEDWECTLTRALKGVIPQCRAQLRWLLLRRWVRTRWISEYWREQVARNLTHEHDHQVAISEWSQLQDN
mmetsp:Transcript_81721/g.162640  ORF Transcript_81721/g.162640 Transcript_81721/m.162640 type:complete len:928 (-) Transcript_81721:245-3028(-)